MLITTLILPITLIKVIILTVALKIIAVVTKCSMHAIELFFADTIACFHSYKLSTLLGHFILLILIRVHSVKINN